ncbi:MAG TPA: phosphoribosylamine--glycine ligase [Cyanobacteria bacterium UBA11149]|nr:phosphoribosylamine--glycine ligase [Cyanobacteria bacterium UBA11367]HBE60613.1 phosphoribosylamine--glycine ligase [Cyanobacteria bacterium UBA11366]HBK62648.1 phosphoribosylamine--glycine ligase [Cyanobacteria bacterium UBA11166]HBR73979.1 phosphoribosylamine--glycine ligase [Cyanobacteria bacterium UBA11159]HBS70114.1 phosphoribosylamine--glycine ligase [Cyanobacteria bacterium UBA11153]HBW88610.1 phosphoribosylamine--glycine ligase [Cyanobacteria bacterium UBA11149]HCA97676.1 phosphor
MKILVIGNGGREHALAWKLLESKRIQQVVCIPGNGGTATLPRCQNLSLRVDDFEGMARFALVHNISLAVVGPEMPLALGITDYLKSKGLMVFGPTKEGAQIEASKSWAKNLMESAGIPTPKFAKFTDATTAIAFVRERGAPIVVKADGLAAGKGVTVANTLAEAIAAVEFLFQNNFHTVIVEEWVTGEEVSVLALTDGVSVRILPPAQDHKRIGEGDTGPNTGGMGAFAPAPLVTPQLMARIEQEILQPTVDALRQRDIDYRGILYAGLMITPQGNPTVLEFNCRFGDPETQAILPLLETPLEDLILACVHKKLSDLPPISWKSGAGACVVAAAQGYPGSYKKGHPISGITQAQEKGTIVFSAGTKLKEQQQVTDGGRVLSVAATGDTLAGAIAQAYAGINSIEFEGMYYRKDIGDRAIKTSSIPNQ